MKIRTFAQLAVLAAALGGATLLHADEIPSAANDATLAPGKYVVMLSPPIDDKQAGRISKALKKISEINGVKVQSTDSAAYFSVRDKKQLNVSQLTEKIKEAEPTVSVNAPVIEQPIQADPDMNERPAK